MRRPVVLLLSTALAVGALVACGGDDEEPEEARLSEEEFVDRGNAICVDSDERLQELFGDLPTDRVPTGEELDDALEQALPELERVFDELEALRPPEELQPELDRLVASGREAVDELEEAGGEALLSGDEPFADANARADDLGLDRCAD